MVKGQSLLSNFASRSALALLEEDVALHDMLLKEYRRQTDVLTLVASSSITDPSVLACGAMVANNVTAEGYPNARFHGGCRVIDEIECLAIERAKTAFGASFANVQPHSASAANQVVMFGLLRPGDTILGMELDSGGHLTHGARVSISGQYFNAVGYGLTPQGTIDYEQVHSLAARHRPKLIVCGTTSYPRVIDFQRFRQIADDVDAFLLADISHIAGLVVAGEHPNPINHAHITTTCTHKQLCGPRGGLILSGADYDRRVPGSGQTLAQLIQKAVFPLCQGAPMLNSIAGKARALDITTTEDFRRMMRRIVVDAKAVAGRLQGNGYRVVSGGTDNHLVVIDVLSTVGITGLAAQRALEECGIVVNKNRIPDDRQSSAVASGIRLGTNTVAARGFGAAEMVRSADAIHQVLSAVKIAEAHDCGLAEDVKCQVRQTVADLCTRFPIRGYSALTTSPHF